MLHYCTSLRVKELVSRCNKKYMVYVNTGMSRFLNIVQITSLWPAYISTTSAETTFFRFGFSNLQEELARLRAELDQVKGEKQDLLSEKEQMVLQHDQVRMTIAGSFTKQLTRNLFRFKKKKLSSYL